MLVVRDGTITTARLALGGVGTIPWRAREAEAVLVGAPANDQSFRAAAEAAIRDPFTVPGAAFKVELAKRTIVRVLQTVIAGDEQSPLWGRQRADVTVTNGRIHPAGDPSSGATHRDILTRHGLDELVAAPAREQGPPGGHQQRERPAGRAV